MTRLAILTGDTYRFRDRIREDRDRSGARTWTWDADRKAWTRALRDADADMTSDQVESRYVRSIPGIGNRGSLTVTIEEVA